MILCLIEHMEFWASLRYPPVFFIATATLFGFRTFITT